jgi:hypothetical protein
MKREVLELLQKVEMQPRILSVLMAMGLINSGAHNYSSAKLTQKGKEFISDDKLTDEIINKLRDIFPAGDRGSLALVKTKMNRFMNEHENASIDDILRAAQLWVRDKGAFCGKAQYFFYKRDNSGGEESRCEEFLEYVSSKKETDLENVI